jgi:microcystin-dependent protein
LDLNSSTPKALFVKNAGIDTAQIKDDAVTSDKLADATLTFIKQAIKEELYPSGSLLTTTVNYADSAAVVAAYGGTTWVRFAEGEVLVGHSTTDSDFNAATSTTGGVKEVTLAASDIPPHAHKYRVTPDSTVDSGSNGAIVVSGGGGTVNGTSGEPSNTEGQQIGGNNLDAAQTAHTNLQPYITVYMWKRTV